MNILGSVSMQPVVQDLGLVLIHFVWQGAILAAALWLVLLMLRKHSAAARYCVACTTLFLMALAPIVTLHYASSGAGSPFADKIENTPQTAQITSSKSALSSGIARLSDSMTSETALADPGNWDLNAHLPYLVSVWAMGVLVLSLRFLGGWTQTQYFRHRLVESLSGKPGQFIKELQSKLGVNRPVLLLKSALVRTPVLIGWLRPAILLPASVLTGLSQGELETILAHEMAHVRRGDYLVNLLQCLAETLLFYHPAVWWVSHRIRVEREFCCDDLAVGVCGSSITYAHALAELEELRGAEAELAMAAVPGKLLPRIRRLVCAERATSERASWLLGAILAIALVGGLLIAGRTSADSLDGSAAEAVESVAVEGNAAEEPADQKLSRASVPETPPSVERSIADQRPLGVAVLDLTSIGSDPALRELSAQLNELLAVKIAETKNVRLVERKKLQSAFGELHLSSSGLVSAGTAMKLGKITGANVLVSGKVMKIEPDYVVTLRLINTETSEVDALTVESGVKEGVLALASATGDAIAGKLGKLDAIKTRSTEPSPYSAEIEQLRRDLMGIDLPTVAVRIPESHIGTVVPDPAGENELISVLTQVGFRVVDVSTFVKRQPSQWWLNIFRGRSEEREGVDITVRGGARGVRDILHNEKLDKLRESADIFVIGEAFSESAGQNYGFESCRARVEIKAIDTQNETIAFASSTHATAADTAEFVAGKRALKTAGGEMGIEVAKGLAKYWQKADLASSTK